MKPKDFIPKCKELVANHHNNDVFNEDVATPEDVFVVWSCKTLQNNKALLSLPFSNSLYYEITFDGDRETIYFCAYSKTEQIDYSV